MYAIAPPSRSGSCLFSNAALIADRISALERPAITILLRRKTIGTIERAAWRFIQSAALTFGFQNSGQSNAAIQPLSTLQTNPFLPATAVSYPCRPRTRIFGSYLLLFLSAFFSVQFCLEVLKRVLFTPGFSQVDRRSPQLGNRLNGFR